MLFDTRYFWAVFTSKNPEFLKKLRTIFDSSKTTYASSISLYEVYKLTISEEDRTVAEIRVNSIEKEFTIIDVDPMIAEEAARISHRVKVPMASSALPIAPAVVPRGRAPRPTVARSRMVAARLIPRIGFVFPMACKVVINRKLWAEKTIVIARIAKGIAPARSEGP